MKSTKTSVSNSWRIWLFVAALNLVALGGVYFLKIKGIDLYHFRGGN